MTSVLAAEPRPTGRVYSPSAFPGKEAFERGRYADLGDGQKIQWQSVSSHLEALRLDFSQIFSSESDDDFDVFESAAPTVVVHDCREFFWVMGKQQWLKQLSLRSTGLVDEQLHRLTDHILRWKNLERLGLSGNHLSAKAIIRLVTRIEKHPKLTEIWVRSNPATLKGSGLDDFFAKQQLYSWDPKQGLICRRPPMPEGELTGEPADAADDGKQVRFSFERADEKEPAEEEADAPVLQRIRPRAAGTEYRRLPIKA
jgi:hypothetical protein